LLIIKRHLIIVNNYKYLQLESINKISVITIVYNGEAFIERTIKSVIGQTYSNIEYLIIDGNSKDNTLEIAKKYQNSIAKLVSEPDKGLYDAMNKGLKLATGDFVIFMNAGDEFFDKDVLTNCINRDNGASDIYYGETMYVSETFQEIGIRSKVTPHSLPSNLTWKDMKHGMVVCHQSIIIRKNICSEFDIKHPFCADIDWIIKALKKTNRVLNSNTIISKYLKGGLSDKKHRASLIDRFKVLSIHFGVIQSIISHTYIIIRALNRKIFKA
jgi:glycosyltransferase involved in cell wall biosynthesis